MRTPISSRTSRDWRSLPTMRSRSRAISASSSSRVICSGGRSMVADDGSGIREGGGGEVFDGEDDQAVLLAALDARGADEEGAAADAGELGLEAEAVEAAVGGEDLLEQGVHGRGVPGAALEVADPATDGCLGGQVVRGA